MKWKCSFSNKNKQWSGMAWSHGHNTLQYLPLLYICGITQIWVSLRWSIYILLFGWLPTTLRLPGEKHGPDSIKNVYLVNNCFPLNFSCLVILALSSVQFKFHLFSIQLYYLHAIVPLKYKSITLNCSTKIKNAH